MSRPRKNRLEWLVFALSVVVICGIVGYLVFAAVSRKDSPARLEVFLGEPRKEQALFVVPVVVENRGAKAAAGVRIEVVLKAGNLVERGGFDLSYSPGGSVRRGEVTFSSDPRGAVLSGRASGFELP